MMKLQFAIPLVVVIAAQNSMAKDWHGIVPLKSTRSEVERRFGKPDKWGDYRIGDERVSFEYSDGPCTDLYRALGKENCFCLLAEGTVLSITVEPTVKRKFSELSLDLTKFKKTAISPFPHNFEYSNPWEGITYEVDESDDSIRDINYEAALVDCQNVVKNRASKYRNSWRGLQPLHGTKKDVERVLGVPRSTWDTNAVYETDHEIVTVKYAKGECSELDGGWNVPSGTILELVVGQRYGFPLSQLDLDPSQYERQEIFPFPEIDDPPKVANYLDNANGIVVRTQSSPTGTGDELVVSITYRPAQIDSKLRCYNKTKFAARNAVALDCFPSSKSNTRQL